MIKAVLFDAGGVIVDMKPLLAQFLTIFQPKSKEELWNEINMKSVPLCKCEISELVFWKEMSKYFNKNISDDILKDLWVRDYEKLTNIDEDVMDIVRSLKGKYKLGMVSNTIEPHAAISRKRGIYDAFDIVTLSYEVKMAKDDKEIFLLTAGKLGIDCHECVFVDDVKKFADMANSLGMETILFKDAIQLKSDLVKTGIRF